MLKYRYTIQKSFSNFGEHTIMKKAIIITAIVLVLGGGGALGGWMYHSAKVDEMRNAGVKQLKSSVEMDAYRQDQQEEIQKILDNGEKAIMEAKDQETIDRINSESADSIKEIKTALELDKEEAIAKLKEDYPLKKYREDQQSEIKKMIADGEKAISESKSSEDIEKAVKSACSSMDEIKTDEQLTAEEEAARAAAAAAAKKKKNSSKKKKKKNNSNSGGCVGNDASNFY